MTLTPKDAAATVVAVLVALVFVANVQDWWYLGSDRWATVTMVVIGGLGCPLGARLQSTAFDATTALLGTLGLAALVLAVVGIVLGSHGLLLALTIVLLALWAGTTMRHGAAPPRAVASA